MGGYTGKYSRSPLTVFNEEKNYAFALMQEGVPVTDDDSNADRLELFTRLRRGNQLFGNYGTPNDGFRVQQATSTANNFKLTGGGVGNTNIEQAGKFFMRGISCLLLRDVDYYNSVSDIAEQSIHPRITLVYFDGLDTVVEDSAANWVTNELSGRYVRINGLNKLIASNDQDSFKISGDHTSDMSALDYYILLLAPPGTGTRDDAVYLNVYIDEYDGDDDPEITKQIGGTEVVAQLRAKIIQTLFVREDNPTHGDLADYVDSNGNQHYVFKLARLRRTTANDILTADIDDYTPTIGFESISLSQMSSLKPRVNTVDKTKIYVSPGQVLHSDGNAVVAWPGGTSPAFAVQATNARWDALVLNDAGNLKIIQGAPGVTPVRPPFYGNPIAYVYIDEASGPVIDEVDIDDARTLFTPEPSTWKVLLSEAGDLTAQFTDRGVVAGDKVWLQPGTYTVGGQLTLTGVTMSCAKGSVTIGIDVDDQIYIGEDGELANVQVRLQAPNQTVWNSIIELDGPNATVDGISLISGAVPPAHIRRMFGILIQLAAYNAVVRNCTIGDVAQYAPIRYAQLLQKNFYCPIYEMSFSSDPNDRLGDGTGSTSSKVAQSFSFSPTELQNTSALWFYIENSALAAYTAYTSFNIRIESDSAGVPSGSLVAATAWAQNSFQDPDHCFGVPQARSGVGRVGTYIRVPMRNFGQFLTPGVTYWIVFENTLPTAMQPLPFGGSGTPNPSAGVFRRWNGSAWVASTGGLDNIAYMWEVFDEDFIPNASCLIEHNSITLGETLGDATDRGISTRAISISGAPAFFVTTYPTTFPETESVSGSRIRILNNDVHIWQVPGFSPIFHRAGIEFEGSSGLIDGNTISVMREPTTVFSSLGIIAGTWLSAVNVYNVKIAHNDVQGTDRGICVGSVVYGNVGIGNNNGIDNIRNIVIDANNVTSLMVYNSKTTISVTVSDLYDQYYGGILNCYGASGDGEQTYIISNNNVSVQVDQADTSGIGRGIFGYFGHKIIGNTIAVLGTAPLERAISASWSSSISGNTILNGYYCNRPINGGRIAVTGNHVWGFIERGINAYSRSVVTGNHVFWQGDVTTYSGYAIYGSDAGVYTGNFVYVVFNNSGVGTGAGVYLTGTGGGVFTGNMVKVTSNTTGSTVHSGIRLSSASHWTIVGNGVSDESDATMTNGSVYIPSGSNYNCVSANCLTVNYSNSGGWNNFDGNNNVSNF
jgi:hypothetical protein